MIRHGGLDAGRVARGATIHAGWRGMRSYLPAAGSKSVACTRKSVAVLFCRVSNRLVRIGQFVPGIGRQSWAKSGEPGRLADSTV